MIHELPEPIRPSLPFRVNSVLPNQKIEPSPCRAWEARPLAPEGHVARQAS